MPDVYTPPRQPWAHQFEALRRLDGAEAYALLMGKRTGKTKTTLDDFGRLEIEGKARNLLIIAPGGVYKGWIPAVLGSDEDPSHLSADLLKRVLVHCWVSGSGATDKRALARFMAEGERPRVLLMNVEALSSVKAAREVAVAFLKSGPSVAVVDESTCIKNPQSKRTKFVVSEIGSAAKYRRILSGLPTPKSPLDIYSQFEFLDWRILGFRSYFAFRARYANMRAQPVAARTEEEREKGERRFVQVVDSFRDLDDLHARMQKATYRVRLEECYDVPPKMYLWKDVELTPEQTRIYAEMKQFATAQLDATSHVTATIVIAQITRLSQILCGHTVDEEGNEHEIPENRTDAVMEILEEYDGKAIIWCAYGKDIERISARLAKEYGEASVARFYGGNVKTREDDERRFKYEPECKFMVATAAAGGRGRTWTVANLIIYHSNTEDLEHRDQSEERGSGIGKDEKVTVVDLRVRGTVDEKKIKALRAKINLATAVMGDGYKEWLI